MAAYRLFGDVARVFLPIVPRRDAQRSRGRPAWAPAMRRRGHPRTHCQSESKGAQRHLSPRRTADCELRTAPTRKNPSAPLGHLPFAGEATR